MRISDYIEQSFINLWKKKLRTFLTTFGVVIGVGALVCMIAFGKGLQKNVTKTFNELELFNYLGVYQRSDNNHKNQSSEDPNAPQEQTSEPKPILDDDFILELTKRKDVEWAFPEMRFPAMVRLKGDEEFTLIQVLPAKICQAGIFKLRAGKPYESDDANSLIISDSLLHRLDIKEPETIIGEQIEISTLSIDFSLSNIPNIISFLQGRGLPFSKQNYPFTIAGVTKRMGVAGPMLMRGDVLIPHGTSEKMEKIQFTSISDIFASTKPSQGYSTIGIRLSSPKYVEPLKKQMEELGFETFSFMDQLEEIKTGFIFVDMFLFAVGMIAIVVASLGIINTMVMSILERYKEIGIMKAVGASDRDVKKIFFFEAGVIGFMGGVFGLALGWIVSLLINLIINGFANREGVPYINFFSFTWWLCLGAIVFSILVSLIAGIYPTIRASRVDPVVALRHD
jgi:putative ABC transport system permease protein